jgi:hypothetical protein
MSRHEEFTLAEALAIAEQNDPGQKVPSVSRTLIRHIGSLQARIDELMLEYCPDEMTQERFDEWARHQVPVDEGVSYTITEAGRKALEGRK